MLVLGFIQWWYGPGWRDISRRVFNRAKQTYANFSISILLRTLFLPWRRIMSPPGGSLEQRFKAMADNAVSRGVGFTIRILALLTAIILIILTLIFGGLLIIIWPLLPIISIVLIVLGFTL